MTEFEQQVAEALRLEILKVRELHSPEALIAIAFALAPRVAAAIEAMGYSVTAEHTDELPPSVGEGEVQRGREAALAVLRRTST